MKTYLLTLIFEIFKLPAINPRGYDCNTRKLQVYTISNEKWIRTQLRSRKLANLMHAVWCHRLSNGLFRYQFTGWPLKKTAAAKCACLKRIEDTKVRKFCKCYDLPDTIFDKYEM